MKQEPKSDSLAREHSSATHKSISHRDSNTRVYPLRKHGVGIWGNRRVPMTIRVDEELKKQFKSFSQRVFGSSCLPLECVMASLLASSVELEKQGVYPSHTVNINFENIRIERNLRARRSLPLQSCEGVDEESGGAAVVQKSKKPVSLRGFVDCRGLSDGALRLRYLAAKKRRSYGDVMMCAGELKRRGNGLYVKAQEGLKKNVL